MLARIKSQIGDGQVGASTLDAMARWLDLTAKLAKMLADTGHEERRVRIAEAQAMLLAQVIRAILGRLGLTAEQQLLMPSVVAEELARVAAVPELEAGG